MRFVFPESIVTEVFNKPVILSGSVDAVFEEASFIGVCPDANPADHIAFEAEIGVYFVLFDVPELVADIVIC